MKLKSLVLAGVAACTLAALAPAANAARIQLGFILDRSGSISEADWDIITAGLGNAIKLIPVGGTDTYEVSVVTFSTNAAAQFSNVVLTTEAERTALANGVAALETLGTSGVTNYTEAFTVMDTVLRNTSALADKTYVNFATDGDPNPNSANAVDKRNEMINTAVDGYVDNISIERIGANVGTVLLRDRLCFPGPCDTTAPFDNFPNQGFMISVDTAQEYADAIKTKVRVVTGQPVPEPATLALFGAGLAGLAFARRRKAR